MNERWRAANPLQASICFPPDHHSDGTRTCEIVLFDLIPGIVNSRRWILPAELHFTRDAQSRLILSWKGQSLALGRVLRCSGDYYEFTPDPNDRVSFEQTRSPVPWATPFAYSFLGGTLPKWHRYRYHRLLWSKAGGGSFDLTWSDREAFYPSSGWMEQYLENVPRFGVNF